MTTSALSYEKYSAHAIDMGLGIIGSGIVALSSLISCKLPFTPVPITFQVTLVLFLALMIGSRAAFYMITSFLLEGALGLPVFAGGTFGLAVLAGPTGGYLLGYLIGGVLIAKIREVNQYTSAKNAFYLLLIGHLMVYATGVLHLGLFIGYESALLAGTIPFIAGDIIKSTLLIKAFYKSYNRLNCN